MSEPTITPRLSVQFAGHGYGYMVLEELEPGARKVRARPFTSRESAERWIAEHELELEHSERVPDTDWTPATFERFLGRLERYAA